VVFSSLLFLFAFLPVVLSVYWASPARLRNAKDVIILEANVISVEQMGWGFVADALRRMGGAD
jgi:hypothetical protein